MQRARARVAAQHLRRPLRGDPAERRGAAEGFAGDLRPERRRVLRRGRPAAAEPEVQPVAQQRAAELRGGRRHRPPLRRGAEGAAREAPHGAREHLREQRAARGLVRAAEQRRAEVAHVDAAPVRLVGDVDAAQLHEREAVEERGELRDGGGERVPRRRAHVALEAPAVPPPEAAERVRAQRGAVPEHELRPQLPREHRVLRGGAAAAAAALRRPDARGVEDPVAPVGALVHLHVHRAVQHGAVLLAQAAPVRREVQHPRHLLHPPRDGRGRAHAAAHAAAAVAEAVRRQRRHRLAEHAHAEVVHEAGRRHQQAVRGAEAQVPVRPAELVAGGLGRRLVAAVDRAVVHGELVEDVVDEVLRPAGDAPAVQGAVRLDRLLAVRKHALLDHDLRVVLGRVSEVARQGRDAPALLQLVLVPLRRHLERVAEPAAPVRPLPAAPEDRRLAVALRGLGGLQDLGELGGLAGLAGLAGASVHVIQHRHVARHRALSARAPLRRRFAGPGGERRGAAARDEQERRGRPGGGQPGCRTHVLESE